MFELIMVGIVCLFLVGMIFVLMKASSARERAFAEMADLSVEDLERMPFLEVIEGEQQTPGTFPDIQTALESTVTPEKQ